MLPESGLRVCTAGARPSPASKPHSVFATSHSDATRLVTDPQTSPPTHGIGAIVSTWSLYLLAVAGATTMLPAAHALASGPLAASQPGFTILDPLTASPLGAFLPGEHVQTGAATVAGEVRVLA
jgi:hypothetical protein